jgi:agmatinase
MSDTSLATFQDSTTNPGFLRSLPLTARPQARWVIAGVPWDGATTNRPGARFGPAAIRRASHMLSDGTHPLFGVSPVGDIADAGDLPLPSTSLPRMREAMGPLVDRLIAGHHMVWLGGDHSITLPLLQGYRRHFGRPLAVVHFDAHCDTWSDHFGEPSGHGTWVYEAVRDGLVDPALFVQLGIRSPATARTANFIQERGGLIFTGRDLRGRENSESLAAITRAVRQRLAAMPDTPLYLTLDIDCLDPAFAPGTGTPEPGGLTTNQVLTLLEDLGDLPWVGMDLCEVAPPYDHAELTSNAAANFVWTYLCAQASANPQSAAGTGAQRR